MNSLRHLAFHRHRTDRWIGLLNGLLNADKVTSVVMQTANSIVESRYSSPPPLSSEEPASFQFVADFDQPPMWSFPGLSEARDPYWRIVTTRNKSCGVLAMLLYCWTKCQCNHQPIFFWRFLLLLACYHSSPSFTSWTPSSTSIIHQLWDFRKSKVISSATDQLIAESCGSIPVMVDSSAPLHPECGLRMPSQPGLFGFGAVC